MMALKALGIFVRKVRRAIQIFLPRGAKEDAAKDDNQNSRENEGVQWHLVLGVDF